MTNLEALASAKKKNTVILYIVELHAGVSRSRCAQLVEKRLGLRNSPWKGFWLQIRGDSLVKFHGVKSSLTTERSLLPCVCNPLARSAGIFYV